MSGFKHVLIFSKLAGEKPGDPCLARIYYCLPSAGQKASTSTLLKNAVWIKTTGSNKKKHSPHKSPREYLTIGPNKDSTVPIWHHREHTIHFDSLWNWVEDFICSCCSSSLLVHNMRPAWLHDIALSAFFPLMPLRVFARTTASDWFRLTWN